MCAMIPMLRTLASAVTTSVVTVFVSLFSASSVRGKVGGLPAVVRERLVGLGHLVGVLAPLDAGAEAVARVEHLVHEPLGHRLLAALPGVADQPAQREGVGATGLDLDRHLVGGATDAAALDLERRLDVVERALERHDGVATGLGAAALEGVVDDLLGERALATHQHLVDERGDDGRAVDRVDDDRVLRGGTFAGHRGLTLLALRAVAAAGLLAATHALGVERAANDLVADTGQVLHPAAAHEHDRVLLEVVADTGDVGRDLDAGRQPDTGHLAQGGVRLLRRRRVDARADAAALRTALQRRRLGLADLVLPALADQLRDRGHSPYSCRSLLCRVVLAAVVLCPVADPRGRACRPAVLRPQRFPAGRGGGGRRPARECGPLG